MRVFHKEDIATVPPLCLSSLYASQSAGAIEDQVVPLLVDIYEAVADMGDRLETMEQRVTDASGGMVRRDLIERAPSTSPLWDPLSS